MATKLTKELGRFVSGVKFAALPQAVVASVKMAFADSLGVALAASQETAPRLLRALVASGGTEATCWLDGARMSAADAAWINGTAAHALDYDDVAQRGGHISACVVPAVLAEAEALCSSGAEMIAAYVAGYEVVSELVRRDSDDHFSGGWHPTSIFGSLGAAAACASLRKLDVETTASALAIAASQSSGIVSNFGTMTKPMHVGNAARSGVVSARLAASGFTGSSEAIEAQPGLLTAVSAAGRLDLDSAMRAGNGWQIGSTNRLGIKKYPLCYCAHRAVDGIIDLVRNHDIEPDQVETIVVSLTPRNAMILKHHAPKTGLEAKFSIEFSLVAALIAGKVGLAELNETFVQRSDVQDMIGRVEIDDSAKELSKDRVVLRLINGRQLDSGPIEAVRGDADSPLSHNELWIKFEDCVRPRLTSKQAAAAFELLMEMERLSDAGTLAELLRPEPIFLKAKGAA
jgi:2-methylcitrate dehydratase PrpD